MNPISSLDTQPTRPTSTSIHREHCAQCSSLCKLDGEILEAQSTVDRLEFEVCENKSRLERLLGERKAMKAKLNAVHDRLTRKLPLELIARIFRFCMPDDDGSISPRNSKKKGKNKVTLPPMPLLLGSISKMWQDIAWSIPHLWTCMTVYLRSTYDPCQLDAASAWLARSKVLPLSVHIKTVASRKGSKGPDPIIELINQHSSRWRKLTLAEVTASLVSQVRGDGTGAPALQTLYIATVTTSSRRVPQQFVLDNVLPSPAKIDVRGFSFSATKINWANATHIRLGGLCVAECVTLFRTARGMVECQLEEALSQNEIAHPNQIPDEPIVHHLLSLNVASGSVDLLSRFLYLPSLTTLSYKHTGTDDIEDDIEAVRLSLDRWGCHLTVLCLEGIRIRQADLIQLLGKPPFPLLESLSLVRFTVDHHFLGLLHPKSQCVAAQHVQSSSSSSSSSDSENHFLPRLRSLSFHVSSDCTNFSWKAVLSLFPIHRPTRLGESESEREDGHVAPRRRLPTLQHLGITLDSGRAARIVRGYSSDLLRIADSGQADLSLTVPEGNRDLIKEFKEAQSASSARKPKYSSLVGLI
ncbi:unnamed protein product [Cyclocybe aegerita]|uniref:F-box domain-containing protein n=1 Tax=Cyclocybe aegerita TaxID=1973307 RepID=A0A8S0WN39_CYCAE|nr:unnamed protein product [Cyclocybe aegerita]